MSFIYPKGRAGITLGGHDLSEFSAKLQTGYTMGAPALSTATFQGKSRSTLLLLDQTFGPLEIILPLEFWGKSRQDTVSQWTRFLQAASGKVRLDLGDGYEYAVCATDLGKPVFLTDECFTVDVTFQGFRQGPEIVLSTQTDLGSSVFCPSTFPRTDCKITFPKALLGGAKQVAVTLGANSWYLKTAFTGTQDLVLDGVNKIFLLGGNNVTAQMTWEDFPYLVPGENLIAVYINTIGVTRGVELAFRPTYL